MAEENYERFIDADEQESFRNEIQSYESIIVRQIQKCVEVLSQEEIGGYFKYSKQGAETYVEDVKEVIINSIETLRMLLTPFIKNSRESIQPIRDEIKAYEEEVGEREISYPGKGMVKIKELKMLDKTSPIMKDIVDYKCKKYREMFEILVTIYNKKKSEIAAASIDN